MSQVAELIGVHRTTIMRLLDAGKPAVIKLGVVAL
jgi:predicted DNA-binding transcriptional regulator AlpA